MALPLPPPPGPGGYIVDSENAYNALNQNQLKTAALQAQQPYFSSQAKAANDTAVANSQLKQWLAQNPLASLSSADAQTIGAINALQKSGQYDLANSLNMMRNIRIQSLLASAGYKQVQSGLAPLRYQLNTLTQQRAAVAANPQYAASHPEVLNALDNQISVLSAHINQMQPGNLNYSPGNPLSNISSQSNGASTNALSPSNTVPTSAPGVSGNLPLPANSNQNPVAQDDAAANDINNPTATNNTQTIPGSVTTVGSVPTTSTTPPTPDEIAAVNHPAAPASDSNDVSDAERDALSAQDPRTMTTQQFNDRQNQILKSLGVQGSAQKNRLLAASSAEQFLQSPEFKNAFNAILKFKQSYGKNFINLANGSLGNTVDYQNYVSAINQLQNVVGANVARIEGYHSTNAQLNKAMGFFDSLKTRFNQNGDQALADLNMGQNILHAETNSLFANTPWKPEDLVQSDRVPVLNPQGHPMLIRRGQVDDALADGWKLNPRKRGAHG